jgi:hypothetical protein
VPSPRAAVRCSRRGLLPQCPAPLGRDGPHRRGATLRRWRIAPRPAYPGRVSRRTGGPSPIARCSRRSTRSLQTSHRNLRGIHLYAAFCPTARCPTHLEGNGSRRRSLLDGSWFLLTPTYIRMLNGKPSAPETAPGDGKEGWIQTRHPRPSSTLGRRPPSTPPLGDTSRCVHTLTAGSSAVSRREPSLSSSAWSQRRCPACVHPPCSLARRHHDRPALPVTANHGTDDGKGSSEAIRFKRGIA